MARTGYAVSGYKELLQGLKDADKETRRDTRAVFRRVGDIVRTDAAGRFATTDARSAAGYRTRVRQRGIAVEQSLRKTTGKHPGFGALQMRRALLPAAAANEDSLERGLERALDEVAARFNRGGVL